MLHCLGVVSNHCNYHCQILHTLNYNRLCHLNICAFAVRGVPNNKIDHSFEDFCRKTWDFLHFLDFLLQHMGAAIFLDEMVNNLSLSLSLSLSLPGTYKQNSGAHITKFTNIHCRTAPNSWYFALNRNGCPGPFYL